MIHGRFFGIDRFADPSITELAACVRDASALWALFADGLTGMDARLYRNETATVTAMREAIAMLETANEEDVVVLTFATHGTQDYGIVGYDTDLSSWSASRVPLQNLVDAFSASRAKFILCVLDICHSGEAPARVVQGGPRTRAILDLTSVSGVGRVLLAAARSNQSAYEHPRDRLPTPPSARLKPVRQSCTCTRAIRPRARPIKRRKRLQNSYLTSSAERTSW